MGLEFNNCQTKLWNQIFFFFSIENLTLWKMDRITITQRIKIIKIYYKNGNSATATYRALRGDYSLHNAALFDWQFCWQARSAPPELLQHIPWCRGNGMGAKFLSKARDGSNPPLTDHNSSGLLRTKQHIRLSIRPPNKFTCEW